MGESYGGHYTPAIVHKVFVENQQLVEERAGGKKSIDINLAGWGVGNGLKNPSEQYKWYVETSDKNSHSIKVIDETAYNAMLSAIPKYTALIDKVRATAGTTPSLSLTRYLWRTRSWRRRERY